MGKIAFVFSGQGAQKPGMAREFYDTIPSVKTLFDAAEEYRPGTLDQCFSGTEEELKQTENTQPCLYLADLAAAIAAQDAKITADGVAGFSLGEIPALAFAGAFSYIDGFKIAAKRGEIMSRAARETNASMTAVVKLENEAVERICRKFQRVYPVNYNSPGQLVVSGADNELEQFKIEVKAAGGRCLPVAAGGGFHSPFMDGAAKEFGEYLEGLNIVVPSLPIWSNQSGKGYSTYPKPLMTAQINSPVRWESIIRDMLQQGYDTFIETGVGMTLMKINKRIPGAERSFSAETPADIEKILEELNA